MKKLALLILALAGFTLAQGTSSTIAGQYGVSGQYVKFGSDLSDTVLFADSVVYRDSAGTFVQIDNAADSCSQPVIVEKRGAFPIWLMELSWTVEATATASSAFKFNIESRYCKDARLSLDCKAWVPVGVQVNDPNVAFADTIQTLDVGSTDAIRTRGRYFVTGSQVRFCPESQTTGGASDSVFVYDMIHRVR